MTSLDHLALLFTNYTFAMTLAGSSVIGASAGALGSIAYLRREAMLSDVVSHAALPGTMIAFLALTALGLPSRSLTGLLLGAVAVGGIAVFLTTSITRLTVVRVDAAMAVVLSSTFGLGMVLLQHISGHPYPNKGGIQDYLFGNASSITRADLAVSVVVTLAVFAVVAALFKELILVSFDRDQAQVLGYPTRLLDGVTAMVLVIATVIGVKTVGVVLMVAFVITPPVIARQWTRSPGPMVVTSGVVGVACSAVGTYLSLVFGPLPTGPVIVVVMAAVMVGSLALTRRTGNKVV